MKVSLDNEGSNVLLQVIKYFPLREHMSLQSLPPDTGALPREMSDVP